MSIPGPTLIVRYTTDDASDSTPSWTTATADVRGFTTRRGRENELSRVDAGTATITLNNRSRTYDPVVNSGIRPMNRWWIQASHNGTVYDVFFGYAESYQQVWPERKGVDALTVVSLVDEFKVLALDRLPTTDPPRDSYGDVVMFDVPVAYWPLQAPTANRELQSAAGGTSLEPQNGGGSTVYNTEGAIVGQQDGAWIYLTGTQFYRTEAIAAGQDLDPAGLAEFSVEFWFAVDGYPAAPSTILSGPQPGGTSTWLFTLGTTGGISVSARNSGGTNHTAIATSTLTSASIPNQVWYHIVGTITGGNLHIYVDGVLETSTAWTGTFGTGVGSFVFLGNGGTAGNVWIYDEVSFYRNGMTADRVRAHYEAGRDRGFPRSELPGDRIAAVLAASDSIAPSSIRTGAREMTGSYMTGQAPLEELRKAEAADAVDAMLFVNSGGSIVFLDDGHRSAAPWNALQATYGDAGGTALPYADISVDYSESFLANDWTVTKTGGTTIATTDSTSVTRYMKRSQSLTDLPIRDDADAYSIATNMLAKYKDPITRITSLTVDLYNRPRLATDTIAATLGLELGDRIRVMRTPPGGGSIIDQTSFVQKIEFSADPFQTWKVRLGVSPL